MIELDTPGHTTVIAELLPELVACRNKEPWWNYAAEPPAGQLRIADERAVKFVQEVFASVAVEFPGTLFSSGGDEVEIRCYDEDEPTQASLKQRNITLEAALADFVTRTHATLRDNGKTPVVWEELALNHNVGLGKDVIVAVWKSSGNAQKVAEMGLKILQAPSDFAYLDCGLGGWLSNSSRGNSWCDPFKVRWLDFADFVWLLTYPRYLDLAKGIIASHVDALLYMAS